MFVVCKKSCIRHLRVIPYFCRNLFEMETVFDFSKPIAVGADHAGFSYKAQLLEFLQATGYAVKDLGTHSADSTDYPDFAHPVATAVENGEVACGILVCGSANGVAITANKHQGIRAAAARFRSAAAAAGRPDYVRFSDDLAAHARQEAEILYPAAVLVGRFVAAKAPPPK